MAIEYVGPNLLRKLIREQYELLKGDYDRKNPRVQVSINRYRFLEDYIVQVSEGIFGFGSQEEFNRFVDSRISQLRKVYKQINVHKTRELTRTRTLLYKDLERASFLSDEQNCGSYHPGEDAIYLDALIASFYLFLRQKKPYFMDLSAILAHELVHFDFGGLAPKVEHRKHYARARDLLEFDLTIEKGRYEEWIAHEKNRLLLRGLGIEGSSKEGYDKAAAEFKKSYDTMVKCDNSISRLNLVVLEEALAFAYQGNAPMENRKDFLYEVDDEIKGFAQLLYDFFLGMIKTKGKLETLRRAKKMYINLYTSKRHVSEAFNCI